MGEIIYRPLIEDMVWSYSRIECFNSCPYRWFLKYIKGYKDIPMFYSSYGSFMHKLIEQYYKKQISRDEMQIRFLLGFSKEVEGNRPAENTVAKYVRAGSDYLKNFRPFPFKTMEVEKKIDFDIDGIPFVGIIDFLGTDGKEIYIVDNKSRDLKPRSKRLKPTVKDRELDEMLRQQYIYAAAVKQIYGEFPKELCFNCFKTNTLIREPFDKAAYQNSLDWAKRSIDEILNTEDFYPQIEFFNCKHLCGVQDECCYTQRR